MNTKLELSLIVPVFNEQQRISPFLRDLKTTVKKNWEIIFVDDGSTDKSKDLIKNSRLNNLRIISYQKNRGKGFAVKKGIMEASGDYVIFIDADGSIHPLEIKKMLTYLKKYDIVVGDRSLKESNVKQPFLRKFVGEIFNTYANLLFRHNVKDNLCGFKGFKKDISKNLFKNLLSDRWIFDVEILYKIRRSNYSMYEMPINWNHKSKSKMKLYDPLKIAIDLIILRLKLVGLK